MMTDKAWALVWKSEEEPFVSDGTHGSKDPTLLLYVDQIEPAVSKSGEASIRFE